MKRTLYYAVNGSGQGVIFSSIPFRDGRRNVWLGESIPCFSMMVMQLESEGYRLPFIKWSDEPVKLELNLNVC